MLEGFKTALEAGRLHHAWIIHGHRTHDKLEVIWQLINLLLQSNDYSAKDIIKAIRKMRQGSHPDFYLLTITEGSKFITVEQVRESIKFLRMTTVETPFRILIIDSLDSLNHNAANALLKALEEPPLNTIIFLTCHVLGQLLPTIRSRCQILRISDKIDDVFLNLIVEKYPELSCSEKENLIAISNGSWAMVKNVMDNSLLPACMLLADIFLTKENRNSKVLDLAKKAKQNDILWDILQHAIPYFMGERIKKDPYAKNTMQKLDFLSSAEKSLAEARNLHLDREQIIISILS
jgi:DNA polymerase III delta prime subunit